MAPIGVRNLNNYSDALVRKRRKRLVLKIFLSVVFIFILVVATFYFIFFSPYFEITELTYSGLRTIDSSEIGTMITPVMEGQLIKSVTGKSRKNIIFFNAELAKDLILSQFPVIKNVNIEKKYFHTIVFNFSEREAIGVWCFAGEETCSYFDEEGKIWGNALRSSGSLILTVDDNRLTEKNYIDPNLFDKIMVAVEKLTDINIKSIKVEIPFNYVGDFRIYTTRNYYLIFSDGLDIEQATKNLKIFLGEKGNDFTAEYIDLRIEGRIYYK